MGAFHVNDDAEASVARGRPARPMKAEDGAPGTGLVSDGFRFSE